MGIRRLVSNMKYHRFMSTFNKPLEKVFYLEAFEGERDAVADAITDIVVDDSELDSTLDALFTEFLTRKDDRSALYVLRAIYAGGWLSAPAYVIGGARLFQMDCLSLSDYAHNLARMSIAAIRSLPEEQLKVVELAEVAIENEDDGFLDVSDDQKFRCATLSLLSDGYGKRID